MNTFRKIINTSLNVAAIVSLSVLSVLTFAQVISRFVFELPIPWSTDVIRIAFVYSIFLGAAIGARETAHLRVDVMDTIILRSEKLKKIYLIFIDTLVSGFLVFIIVKAIYFIKGAMGQMMPYLRIPISVMYFAILLSAALMLYYLIGQIIERTSKYKNTEEM